MKSIIYIACLLFTCCFAQQAQAQDKVFKMTPQDTIVPKVKEEVVPNKIRHNVDHPRILGGFINFQLWGNLLALGASPLAAYKVTDKFHIGVGGTYLYSRAALYGNTYDAHTLGGRVFARLMVIEGIFAHIEYENHYTPTVTAGTQLFSNRTWISGALFGIDYRNRLGEQTFSTLSLYYNATHRDNQAPFLYGNAPLVIRFNVEYEF